MLGRKHRALIVGLLAAQFAGCGGDSANSSAAGGNGGAAGAGGAGGSGAVSSSSSPAEPVVLLQAALDAQLRGCDLLDPANCLYPFPNDHFTVPAPAGSPQSVGKGGTGKRIGFNLLAMPRNTAGKPIDPSEWNRNDGFSPGQMIVTYVPNIGTEKDAAGAATGPIAGAVPLTDLRRYADAGAPILVLDALTGERHPIWAEIDLNAGFVIPAVADAASPLPKRPALIIRPARNFLSGHRYVVVLRNLRDDSGNVLGAQLPFRVCRDGDANFEQIPPIKARCDHLNDAVFPVLAAAGIARDETLYLSWDFTVASAHGQVSRLVHMRDDAFRNVLGEPENAPNPGEPGYPAGRAPVFSITEVTDNPDERTLRRIRGTFTVPSYVIPADPAPLDDQTALRQQLNEVARQCTELTQGNCGIPGVADLGDVLDVGASGSLPPNRLYYSPAGADPGDPVSLFYGDGLPDRNPLGDLTTTFTCNIPHSVFANGRTFADATPADLKPVRPTLYGHGLLGGQGEVNGQASDFGNIHGFMHCAADWFGFASGDIPNVVTVLVDLSNFPVVPDGSQQGMLNQLFLARLLVHPEGFASHQAFQLEGHPVFDRREAFYQGNSQGGILGGVVVAASKDINRGVLGVLGMNYSTLLSRSTDFATYSIPFYLSYTDDLDRPLLFGLMQMLWDRSENNGYAEFISSNAPMGGPDNQVLLHPAFGDHQVTMWSADVMARTVGARVDAQRVPAARHPDVDGAEYALMEPLNYGDASHVAGSALVPYDEAWLTDNDKRCDANSHTEPPPIGNVPPGDSAGSDPHECPRRDPQARCQMSHFLVGKANAAAGGTVAAVINPASASRSRDEAASCPAVVLMDGAP